MAVRARKPLRRRRGREEDPKGRAAGRASHGHRGSGHTAGPSEPRVLALQRAFAKEHFRVVGVDDGAFSRADRWAPVAAVAVAAPDRVDAMRVGRVKVDGRGASREVVRLVRATGGLEGLKAVLLDGAVVGGFNVVDLDAVHAAVGVPVVAVTRHAPDFAGIRTALWKWFPRDAAERWRLLRAHRLVPLPDPALPVLVAAVGCRARDAALLVRRTTVRGFVPEPIRLAHLVASAVGPAAPPARGKD
jgi:uncharacterized protein